MNDRHTVARLGLALTSLAVVYAGSGAASGWEPSLGWLLQAVIHVGELLVVIAVARFTTAGDGRLGRAGCAVAVAGQVVLAVAEVAYPRHHGVGDTLFAIGPLLTGAGMITAGIVVMRAAATRPGWRRYLPLAVGVWVFLVLIPVLIGSGGPPAPAALLAIAGWDALWALTAFATLDVGTATMTTQRPASTRRSASGAA